MLTSHLARLAFCLTVLLPLMSQTQVLAGPAPQIAIESRFVTVNDNFLEEVGVDFRGLNGCQEQGTLQRQYLGTKPSFAENVGSSLAGRLLGSLTGGGLSFGMGGGSGSDSGSDGPFISDNTLEKALSPGFPFSDGSLIQLQLQPSLHQPSPRPNTTGMRILAIHPPLISLRYPEHC